MSFLLTILVAVIASLFATVIALPKILASRWLEEVFAARARASEHQNAKDVERLRAAIQQELDQLRTLNQYEFEALPRIWGLLVAADRAIYRAILRFRQHPDFNRMLDDELKEWLEHSDLHPLAKRQLSAAPQGERNQLFSKLDDAKLRYEGKKAAGEAADAIVGYAIYLDAELHDQLYSYADYLWKAAVSAEFINENLQEKPWEEFMDSHESRLNNMRDRVRERLRARTTAQIAEKVSASAADGSVNLAATSASANSAADVA